LSSLYLFRLYRTPTHPSHPARFTHRHPPLRYAPMAVPPRPPHAPSRMHQRQLTLPPTYTHSHTHTPTPYRPCTPAARRTPHSLELRPLTPSLPSTPTLMLPTGPALPPRRYSPDRHKPPPPIAASADGNSLVVLRPDVQDIAVYALGSGTGAGVTLELVRSIPLVGSVLAGTGRPSSPPRCVLYELAI
jgi:hypothetical protein